MSLRRLPRHSRMRIVLGDLFHVDGDPPSRSLIGGESRTAHYEVADHVPDRAG